MKSFYGLALVMRRNFDRAFVFVDDFFLDKENEKLEENSSGKLKRKEN